MKTSVITARAPRPIGPFSQALIVGKLVYISAQFGRDPVSGEMITVNIEAETTRVMENLQAILQAAGVDFSHVVKASIFLKDMQDYAKVNQVYASYLQEPFPARETIQVAALPMNVNIEISMIAEKD